MTTPLSLSKRINPPFKNQIRQLLRGGVLLVLALLVVVVLVRNPPGLSASSSEDGVLAKHLALPDPMNPEIRTTTTTSTTANDPPAEMGHPNPTQRIAYFQQVAISLKPVTDKIGNQHTYHNMFGMYLLPYYYNAVLQAATSHNNTSSHLPSQQPAMKMFEIGLGCRVTYGPGASVILWKTLFPRAEIWMADYDKACVERSRAKGQLEGIHVVTGDQGDPGTLKSWIEQASGGNFDIIIDDGGHKNCQISTSFNYLWPKLRPGGYYFIEDLQVGKSKDWQDCGDFVMSNSIMEWIDRLLYRYTTAKTTTYQYEMPSDLLFVTCQQEACVLGKKWGAVNEASPLGGK